MADTFVPILDKNGSTVNVDVRTESTNGDVRQVVVLGDPSVNGGVCPVDATTGAAVHDMVSPTLGGTSPHHYVAAGTAGGDKYSAKGTAGKLFSVSISNKDNDNVYVKFHNTASTPTPGTTAVVKTLRCGVDRDRDVSLRGLQFSSGIGVSITRNMADNDTNAVAAGAVTVDLEYI